jgi:hypothetical protein
VHISATEATCTVPPLAALLARGYQEGAPLPFVLTTDEGLKTVPTDLGFAYSSLVRVAATSAATDEDGTLLVEIELGIGLGGTAVPTADVRVTLAVNDTAEAVLDTTVLVASAGASGTRIAVAVVKGLPDDRRDGAVPYEISVAVSSSDPTYASLQLAAVQLRNLDSAPRVARVNPPALAMLGGQKFTVTGSHFDPRIDVNVASVALGNTTTLVAAAARKSRLALHRSARGDAHDAHLRAVSIEQQQVASSGTATFVMLTPAVNQTGYAPITVTNLSPQGLAVTRTQLVFFTDDCPEEGQYGVGLDCTECPKGGYCPGGNRVWPLSGFWNPSEDSGIVIECNPSSACRGCIDGGTGEETLREGCYDDVGSECVTGYIGRACAECAPDFTRAFGECVACPHPDSQMLNLILDALMWTLYGLAAAMVRDRENLSHIVMLIIAVQEVGAVGQIGSTRLPKWLKRIYEIFYLFSGDITFVKPDCLGKINYELEFLISLVYAVLIGLPAVLLTVLTRTLSRLRHRKHGADVLAARWSHYTDRLVRVVTIHTSVTYFVVCLKSLREIACYPDPQGLHLIPQPARRCFSGMHTVTFAAAMVLLLVYVLGWPIIYIRIMRRAEREGKLYTDLTFQRRWDFLYEQFNVKWRYLFLFEMLISFSVAAMSSFAANHPLRQMIGIGTPIVIFLVLIVAVRPYRRGFENFSVFCLMTANALAVTIGSLLASDSLTDTGFTVMLYVMVAFIAIAFIIILGVNFYFLVWTWTKEDDVTRHLAEGGKDPDNLDNIEFDFDINLAVADATAPAPEWLREEIGDSAILDGDGDGDAAGGAGGAGNHRKGGAGGGGSSSEERWYAPFLRAIGLEDSDEPPENGGPMAPPPPPLHPVDDDRDGDGAGAMAGPVEGAGDDGSGGSSSGTSKKFAGLSSVTIAAEVSGASHGGRKIVPVIAVPKFCPRGAPAAPVSIGDKILAWGASLLPGAGLPPGWSSHDEGVRVVDASAELLGPVQALVDATCRADLLGAGRDAAVSGHTALRVTAVRRIENVHLHRAYRAAVEVETAQFRHLSRPIPQVAASTASGGAAVAMQELLGVDTTAGELLLFHGTEPAIADIISTSGFDTRVSRQGLLGTGVYFGDASSKADEYAGRNSTSGTMILARVWIGDPYIALASQTGFRRPPCVVGHSGQACSHPRFTSVVAVTTEDHAGAVLTKHREYVVYEKSYTYPELVISYDRVGGGTEEQG